MKPTHFSGWAIEVEEPTGLRLVDTVEITHVPTSHRACLPLVSTALFRTLAHARLAIKLEWACGSHPHPRWNVAEPVKVRVTLEPQ